MTRRFILALTNFFQLNNLSKIKLECQNQKLSQLMLNHENELIKMYQNWECDGLPNVPTYRDFSHI